MKSPASIMTANALWILSIVTIFLLSSPASSSAHYPSQLPCHPHPIPTHHNSLFSISSHRPPIPYYCILHHHMPRNHHLPNTPPPTFLGSPPTTATTTDQGEEEMDPRYGVEKRLVPTGPNPLHN